MLARRSSNLDPKLTTQNAERLGIERIVRRPEPRISVSEDDDVDLHYCVLPKAALPEHYWFKEQAVAFQEPFIDLDEIRLRVSWANASSAASKEAAAINSSGSYLNGVHHQLRSGMRRVLRLQFIQWVGQITPRRTNQPYQWRYG